MISCIVPVYNNSDTILHVLNTLLACPQIDEIIAVDDCSQDDSVEKITSLTPEVTLLRNSVNLGKGGAAVRGIKASLRDVLLTCDADLSRLKPHHIEQLIKTFNTGYDMVIAGRGERRGLEGLMASISGERILRYEVIEPYLDFIASRGNGIEQIINYAHQGLKVKIIASTDIGHILKYQRDGYIGSIPAYAKEISQLVETEFSLRRLTITRKLRSLSTRLPLTFE